MNRRILALGAVVVLAAVVGLYVVLRDGGSDAASHDAAGPSLPEVDPGTPRSNTDATRRSPSGDVTAPPVTGSAATPKEYVVGGVRVRDHRTGNHPPEEAPPIIQRPGGRKIDSQVTSAVARNLRAAMAECASNVPPEARGPKPRLDGEITIAIKEHQATITGAAFQPRDLLGASEAAVKQCMQDKAIGLASPSGDEQDIASYAITLSLFVP